VGVESLAEYLDVELTENLEESTLVTSLNGVLPPGLKILQALPLAKRLPPRWVQVHYQVESPEAIFAAPPVEQFLARSQFPVTRRRPKEERTIDLRPLVARLEVLDPSHVQLIMRLVEKDNLKVTDALAAIFNLDDDQTRDLRILKLQSV
jgi:radical SAM-linked protein